MEEQMSLWSFIKETKKIKKPIRLIEMFAGIGAQHRAMTALGLDVESHRIIEWAAPSIRAYNAIHIKDFSDHSEGKSKEEMIQRIKGVSVNYNEPLTEDQLKRKPLEWIRQVYNDVIATKDLINIMDVKGRDLGFDYDDGYEYVMSYSFPCQDLSLAGLGKGMSVSQAEGGTRSGLLWEVERILTERERERLRLPDVLVMENVPQVIGEKNIKDFQKWEYRLSQLGYSNYVKVINSKDCGIPQNRQRCFMVSILGDYAYEFIGKIPLKYRLKDFLDKNVDEKYYLSDKMLAYITSEDDKYKVNPSKLTVNDSEAKTITTREGNTRADASSYQCDEAPSDYNLKSDSVINLGNYGNGHHAKNVSGEEGVMPTITTGNHGLGQAIGVCSDDSRGGVL